MKLNMGCGYNKVDGFVNVDMFEECRPDVVWNLEQLPWPWPDNAAEHVVFNHSLEHVGQSTPVFLGIIKELYRVCRDGATVNINVPHPRHDDFLNDPTHVRAITPDMMTMFSKATCDMLEKRGAANSRLAHYLHVDFEMVDALSVLGEPYSTQLENGTLAPERVDELARSMNNVVREFRITLVAHKPA